MAPACVLLDRRVTFVNHNPAVQSTQSEDDDDEDEEFGALTGGLDSLEDVPSWKEMEEGMAAHLRAMTPAPQLEEPPRVSHLSMVRPALSSSSDDDDDPNLEFGMQLHAGYIAAAHGRFVVLYAGNYRPATSSKGCYLVYDASGDGSLSTVPGIPYSTAYNNVGAGTIVMPSPAPPDDGGAAAAFVLAELLTMFRSTPPQAVKLGTQAVWKKKVGRLPAEVCPPKHVFAADTTFSFDTSVCCWVDLRHGLLLCDSASPGDEAKFHFVPLPDGYAIDTTTRRPGHPQLRAHDFRSVSCVAGTIKFVSLDGYLHRRRRQPDTSVRLTTWTLDLDKADLSLPAKWTQETSTIHDLLPQCQWSSGPGTKKQTIMCPVLCTQQSYLVYLVLAGTETVLMTMATG